MSLSKLRKEARLVHRGHSETALETALSITRDRLQSELRPGDSKFLRKKMVRIENMLRGKNTKRSLGVSEEMPGTPCTCPGGPVGGMHIGTCVRAASSNSGCGWGITTRPN